MKDKREETILTGKKPGVAVDGPDLLIGSEPDFDELRQFFGSTNHNKGGSAPEQPIEDLNGPASTLLDDCLSLDDRW